MNSEHEVKLIWDHGDCVPTLSTYKVKIEHSSCSDMYSMWFEDKYGNVVNSIGFSDTSLCDLIDKLIELEHNYGFAQYKRIN